MWGKYSSFDALLCLFELSKLVNGQKEAVKKKHVLRKIDASWPSVAAHTRVFAFCRCQLSVFSQNSRHTEMTNAYMSQWYGCLACMSMRGGDSSSSIC